MDASRIVDSLEKERATEAGGKESIRKWKESAEENEATENEEKDSSEFCEGLQTISAGLSGFGLSK